MNTLEALEQFQAYLDSEIADKMEELVRLEASTSTLHNVKAALRSIINTPSNNEQ